MQKKKKEKEKKHREGVKTENARTQIKKWCKIGEGR
jgi:hypothetical protein